MAEQYDSSVSSGLASDNANKTSQLASDQKAAQDKGKSAAQSLAAKHQADKKVAKPAPASSAASSTAAPSSSGMGAVKSALSGGLVGAIKNKIDPSKPAMPNAGAPVAGAAPAVSPAAPVTPAGTVGGGNTQISTDSMKGQALTQDPKANLISKGRFSDYRKVFSARGLQGKHSWGSK
jgi:hypothetical protein